MDDGRKSSLPFSVVVSGPKSHSAPKDHSQESAGDVTADDQDLIEEDWSPEDLEAEYMRALEAAEQAELLAGIAIEESRSEPQLSGMDEESCDAEAGEEYEEDSDEPEALPVEPSQVLEALLFVGGTALSPRRLADVINISTMEVAALVERLDRQYAEEARPYFIELEDGHYRLALKAEYEPVRSRVHGQGPKDVRLTPDALEVLALVAYEQPLSREDLLECGKPDADALIRQLIRRDLVTVQRGPDGKQIQYQTSPRFLELFGLRSLYDLPRADDLRFK